MWLLKQSCWCHSLIFRRAYRLWAHWDGVSDVTSRGSSNSMSFTIRAAFHIYLSFIWVCVCVCVALYFGNIQWSHSVHLNSLLQWYSYNNTTRKSWGDSRGWIIKDNALVSTAAEIPLRNWVFYSCSCNYIFPALYRLRLDRLYMLHRRQCYSLIFN